MSRRTYFKLFKFLLYWGEGGLDVGKIELLFFLYVYNHRCSNICQQLLYYNYKYIF